MYNVLIVDDEPAVFEGLSLMLDWTQLGFRQPDCARDSEEALNRLDVMRYHVVITDIRMPGMNGLELLSEIKKVSPDSKTIIISGYDEFSYAKKAIQFGVKDYLLKPVDRHELSGILTVLRAELEREASLKISERKGKIIARDKFYYDLVTGSLTDQEISSNSADYDFNCRMGGYCVALLEIQDFYKLLDNNIENARNIKKAARRVVEEAVFEKNLGHVYEDTEGLLGFLLCGAHCEGDVEHSLRGICERINRTESFRVTVGYGSMVQNVKGLRSSREKAFYALERRFIAGGENVVCYEKVDFKEGRPWDFAWNGKRLVSAAENNDLETMKSEMNALSGKIGEKQLPPDMLRSIAYNLLFGLCAVIKRNGGNADSVFNYSEIQTMLEGNPGSAEFLQWLDRACADTASYIQSLTRNKLSRVIDQIKDYLDKNYDKHISIKQISRLFYLNPAYLGQLFKNSVGETISDYINKKRIAQVKKMVASEDILIHEALDRVGYHNQGYFYKKFKLYEGIPFAEYNENLKKEKNLIRMNFSGYGLENAKCRM